MLSDVADVLHDLSGVDSLVVCSSEQETAVRALVWADVPVDGARSPDVRAALQAAEVRGYSEAVVVAADVPDLPQMIIAKMFQSLATSPVAIASANGGGAVALGAALPAPSWLDQADLDAAPLIADLRAAAPRRSDVRLTPGWHRLRSPGDLQRLDHGLEGWESTRALLAGLRIPGEA
jgi:glycosyltransferase A (GT-A) superfamily protein (DUF2064 family)